MVQKASKLPTKTDVLIRHDKAINELFGLNRKRLPPLAGIFGTTPIFGATPSPSGSSGGTGNFLRTQGDTMIGPIAFFPVDVLKSVGDNSIDIGQATTDVPGDYSTYVLVTGTGILQFIDGAAWAGQYLILQGTNQQILTIQNSTILVAPTVVGDGFSQIITVTTTNPHGFTPGEIIQIDATTNFNARAPVLSTPSPTTFTYDLGSIGSATPEGGIAKNGTIVTSDGNNITLDGTINDLNAPSLTLIFDVTIIGNGAWRVVSSPIAGTGVSGYVTIQDEGIAVLQRDTMNFIGTGVSAVDDPANNRTNITISSAIVADTPWTVDHDANKFILFSLKSLLFDTIVGGFPALTNPSIFYRLLTDSLVIQAQSGQDIDLQTGTGSTPNIARINESVIDFSLNPISEFRTSALHVFDISQFDKTMTLLTTTGTPKPSLIISTIVTGTNDGGDLGLTTRPWNNLNVEQIRLREGFTIVDIPSMTAKSLDFFLNVPLGKQFRFVSDVGLPEILGLGIIGGQKRINLNSSELTNFNTLFSGASGTNKRIDSVSAGYNFDTFFGTEFQFRVRNAGDTAFVNVGKFNGGGFNADGLPIQNIFSISFTNLGNAISQTASDMTFGVPALSVFKFNIGGVTEYEFSASQITMNGNLIDNAGNVRSDIFTVQNSGGGGNVLITSAFPTLSASIFGDWLPTADNTHDLGKTPGNRWRDLNLAGIANIGTLNIGLGDSSIQHTMFGFLTIVDRVTPADPISASSVNLFLDDSTGELSVRKFGSETVSLEGAGTNGGGGGEGFGAFASIVKSADETRTSTTTLVVDNELKWVAEASTTYAFELTLFLTQGGLGASGQFKMAIDLPSGTFDAQWTIENIVSNADGTTSSTGSSTTAAGLNHVIDNLLPLVVDSVTFKGRVVIAGTGGLVSLKWAQNVSDPLASTIKKGSYLRVFQEGAGGTGQEGAGLTFAKVVKTVDQTINNSTVFIDDDELFFVGTANRVYYLNLTLFSNFIFTADFNTRWTLPSGATGEITTNLLRSDVTIGTLDITSSQFHSAGSGVRTVTFQARIEMGGTTGICQLQWAQAVAVVNVDSMLRGSTLVVYEEGSEGGGAITPGEDAEGRFAISFVQRGTATAVNKTLQDPLILAKWQIIPPAGLTEFNQIGSLAGNMLSFMRRVSGIESGRLAFLESDDGITYDDFIFLNFTTDASFTRKSNFDQTTSLDEARRFLAVGLFDTGGTSTIEAREIHMDVDVILPAGYNLVQLI